MKASVAQSLIIAGIVPMLCAGDWPQWRGAHRDARSDERLPARFPEQGLRLKWKQPIGGGYAGISVAGGRVYALDYQKTPAEIERVLCFDAKSGKRLWLHDYPVKYAKMEYGNGPRSTPTVYKDRVYTYGARGMLCCLGAEKGNLLWSRDTTVDFKGRVPMWGHACSPFIAGERLIVQVGGEPDACIVALAPESGKELWRALADRPGYSSPIEIATKSGALLIVWTAEHLAGLDPASGQVRWRFPHTTEYDVTISDPVMIEDVLLVSDYWKGSKAIRLNSDGNDPKLVWEGKRLSLLMSTPLKKDGFIYALDRRDGLKCLELATGKVRWEGEHVTPPNRSPHATLIWAGERALILNTPGELQLAELSPNGYRLISKAKVIDETWAHPAVADGCFFVRDNKEIRCYSLAP